jgi:YVTN family beta-propeller protein
MPKFPLPNLLLAAAAMTLATAASALNYGVTDSIPGPDGGWDYANVDSATRTLYVAHGDTVFAADLAHGAKARSFGTVAHAHAVVPIAGKPELLVTSGGDDTVRLFDTRSGKQLANIAVGTDPDAAFYMPSTGQAVVMNAKAGTVSVIDVAARKVVRTITLKPGLEFGQAGPGNTLFVNNEDENEIETADLATGKAGPSIALSGCTGPSGLAYDVKSGELISACDNGKAAVADARTHKLVKLLEIGAGPDAVILDAAHRLAFIPCGKSGTVTMIALDGAAGAHVIGTVKSETGARTGALDPGDGALYLPTARFAPPATPGARPAALPGSFHVVVMRKS